MNLLAINAGSSSVRLAAFSDRSGHLERLASERLPLEHGEPRQRLQSFVEQYHLESISAVVHRIVHGGSRFIKPVLLDGESEQEIGRLGELAPLHNRRALRWLHAAQDIIPGRVPQVGVFDTGFFSSLPAVAATYALPRELSERHGLRRYGFHGLAHASMWRQWRAMFPQVVSPRLVTLQLGAGCSMTAIRDGNPVDTSMGFSPLEGLVMATRCGDVDPGLLVFLQRVEELSPTQLDLVLNQGSGLLGISGTSGDIRQLLATASDGARLAVDVYCYRARKYLGAYIAALGGIDGVVFGGGVGEHVPEVRARILENMAWCGLELDVSANRSVSGIAGRISAATSKVEAWVLPPDEAAIMAEEGLTVIRGEL